MAKSKSKKKIFNMAYSFGAAVVIIGALFKIQHWEYGAEILTIGMVVEALVFFLSAFDSVEDDLDWTKVYPELAGGDKKQLQFQEEGEAERMLSQKLDKLLEESNLDVELMNNLGKSIQNFQAAAEELSVTSSSITSTARYNEQMEKAALHIESLNNVYKSQAENANKHQEINNTLVENSELLKKQMESLANNLSSLNDVYGGMLSAMSKK